MEKCLLCGVEFERLASGCMVCYGCDDRLGRTRAQYKTLEERLWGNCFRSGSCWEYGSKNLNGRPNAIRADRRQVPPSHVALWLSGHARPSPLHVVEHAHGANAMCVNPEHLSWREQPKLRGPMWAHLMTQDQLATYHERFSAKRAEYQRNWRRRIKTLGGTKSVREAHNVRDMARAREVSKLAREAGPTPLVKLERPIVVAVPRVSALVPVDLEAHYVDSIAEGQRILSAPATTPAPTETAKKPNRAALTLPRAEFEAETARALSLVDDDTPLVTAAELAALEAEAAASRAEPIPSEPVPAPSAVKLAPGPGLLASLAGAKIAPVD